jgi:hypothetical protein
MSWTSPRKDSEHARKIAEDMAKDHEKDLGRSLTPSELKEVHGRADKAVKAWGQSTRKGK